MFTDKTSYHIQQFKPRPAAIALKLINDLRAEGIPAYISSGVRTVAEQRELVRKGASRTLQSKHLEGRAFDIDILGYGRDELPRWFWDLIGQYGESLGLKWGGRFKGFYDGAHFEL